MINDRQVLPDQINYKQSTHFKETRANNKQTKKFQSLNFDYQACT